MSNADKLEQALEKVANWETPETGETWDNGSPMPLIATKGINGVRDYFKDVARQALASYRASKDVADDELIERLRLLERSWASMYHDACGFPKDGTNWTIQYAIDRIQAHSNPWVKIEDIPDEWKDGRPIDLLLTNDRRSASCDYKETRDLSGWWSPAFRAILAPDIITHAMLPPTLPQEEG